MDRKSLRYTQKVLVTMRSKRKGDRVREKRREEESKRGSLRSTYSHIREASC